MREKSSKLWIVFFAAAAAINKWTLSLIYPDDGFHFWDILEKSIGRWGLASAILIWSFDAVLLVCGVIFFIHRSSLKKGFFVLSVFAVSFPLLFGMMEIGIRIISPPNMFSPYLPLRPHNKLDLHVQLDGVSPEARNTTNMWGLRGDEPPAKWNDYYTIVVVGGSTAQCYYLDDHKTWPCLLQQKLRAAIPQCWVGNGGISGHSTRAHILFVREAIAKMHPKMALLLVGVNDLWYSMNDEARIHGSPAEQTGWKYFILGNSRLVQVLFLWKIILFDHVVVLERSANEDFTPEPLAREMPVPDDLRQMLPSLDEYGRNIRTIIDDLESMKVRPVFLTQPLLFDSTQAWKSLVGWDYSANGKKGKLSAATYAKLLDIFNEELKMVCAEKKVEVFDLASEIPHRRDYFYDMMHFNEAGASLVADKIAAYLQSRIQQR